MLPNHKQTKQSAAINQPPLNSEPFPQYFVIFLPLITQEAPAPVWFIPAAAPVASY